MDIANTDSGASIDESESSQAGRDPVVVPECKRFNDFHSIDWIQDALSERQRELGERAHLAGPSTIRSWLRAMAHASQSWFVVALVGAAIGISAALISIITVWLADIKQGHCSAGWWLNRKFCCWEIEAKGIVGSGSSELGCSDWVPWSNWTLVAWTAYLVYAVLFAFVAAFLVKSFAPFAAGSGISEIKCILSGFMLEGYLGWPTLAIKSITLPLAIASGLSVGKEGPSVHMAGCVGHVVGRFFSRFDRSQARMREIVTASSAAGVAVAFGSPIGGVLFALEEMTVTFPLKTMWRSFFCALIATVTLAAINPFRTGKLVLFQVSYDRDWHFFEIGFFILIGVFGGLYGAFVIKYNFQVQSFRRNHLAAHGITEAVTLAALTSLVCYSNKFLRIDMTESLDILFRECEGGGDYDDLCQTWAQWQMVNSLLLATVLRTCLVILSYGCKVPAGIFVPSMAIGATFGRMVGILVKAAYRAYPHASLFAACDPEKPCITPGTYAFLGAAAALAGIMRITVTVVVVMFELTGALTYILPTMIVVMVTKAVSELFDKGGIADQAIKFNGFPSLEKEDEPFNAPVADIMQRDILALTAQGMTLADIENCLRTSEFSGFPVIKSNKRPLLLGYIDRAQLSRALDNLPGIQSARPDTLCSFVALPRDAEERTSISEESVDFSDYVNETPLAVSPRQPVEIVSELFRSMGPRIIFVEDHGLLVGLLTVKDLLKEQILHEHRERQDDTSRINELEDVLEEARTWLHRLLGRFAPGSARPSPTIVFDAARDSYELPQRS